MKRLILMGGRPWFAADGGKRFTDVLFRYYPQEVKLAFCIFAQPEEQWEDTRNWNVGMFDKFKDGRIVSYQTMTLENFTEVSAWADIIYLTGGDPLQLTKSLQPFDLARLWDGKVLAGSSAGADLFCSGFTFLQNRSFSRGLGWVNASCIPHWRSQDFEGYTQEDWDWAEQESLRQLPDAPVLCIPEGDFVELTIA